jgi:hypothetical protein
MEALETILGTGLIILLWLIYSGANATNPRAEAMLRIIQLYFCLLAYSY